MSEYEGMDRYGESWKKTARKGPWKILWRVVGIMIVLSLIFGAIGFVGGWFGEAAQVAKEEFGPRAMLTKYEWFKDAAANCEKKLADIEVYKVKINEMKADYEGVHRKEWDRVDKQTMSQWKSELAGVAASYNGLAAEYNAQMAKFNWSFAEAGKLPEGATEPLPREFKPYVNSL